MKLSFVLVPLLLSVGSVFGQVSGDRENTIPMYATAANHASNIHPGNSLFEPMPNNSKAVSKFNYSGRWQTPGTAWFASAGLGGQV